MESNAGPNPIIRGIIVVGIAIVVDIAHVRRGPTPDGTEPPIDTLNKKRRAEESFVNFFFYPPS